MRQSQPHRKDLHRLRPRTPLRACNDNNSQRQRFGRQCHWHWKLALPLPLGADYNYPGPSVTGDAFACDMNSIFNMVCTWHGLPTFQSPICGLGFVGILNVYEIYDDLQFPCLKRSESINSICMASSLRNHNPKLCGVRVGIE